MGEWTAPFGIFYTWGGYEDLTWYDYLVSTSPEDISSKDLLDNWRQRARPGAMHVLGTLARDRGHDNLSSIIIKF
jgi:hypothetical protein